MRRERKRDLADDVRAILLVSIRRACRNLCVDTSSYHYKSRCPSQTDLMQRIKETAETRERFTGAGVVAALEIVCREVGYPKSIRVDQGREFGINSRGGSGRRSDIGPSLGREFFESKVRFLLRARPLAQMAARLLTFVRAVRTNIIVC